jgi:glycosyltransferase involved in cell wall biosynthesis
VSEIVLGLTRHAETERLRPGASPGTSLLFTTLERSLRGQCAVRLLPAGFYSGGPAAAVQAAQVLLSEVDALVLSVPPHPLDFGALVLVRRMLGGRLPFIYLPLGEFPRGARCYRHLHRYLGADDLIWFSSTADRAVYQRLVAASPARVCVIPFGIDPAPYRQAAGQRAATRRALGVAEEDVVFVVHGRIGPEKNVHAATALLGQLARRGYRARLWLAGPGEDDPGPVPRGPRPLPDVPGGGYRDVLTDSLRGADARLVWWWGDAPREQVARIIAAADIGLNLTLNRDENFGFSTVEAMAAGLPVIGTDWGGLKDTIEDGVTGYRIPTVITGAGVAIDHFTALQRAVRLSTDPAARRRMGAAAVSRVDERYLLEQCTSTLLQQVRDLLGRSARPRQHRWTPLGGRLADRYSIRIDVPPGTLPTSLPPRPCPRDEDIVRSILGPYGTRDQDAEPDPGAVFMLASSLLRTGPATVKSGDPIYPVAVDLDNRVEAVVCALLETEDHLTADRLSSLGRIEHSEVVATLRRLLAAGVVVQAPPAIPTH